MNDEIKNGDIADRFHIEHEQMNQQSFCIGQGLIKYPKSQKFMKFVPQGKQLYEIKSRGYSFTEDKDYPVLESNEHYDGFKTIDDTGKERWIKDDYFVPTSQNLLFGKECRFDKPQPDPLEWENLINGKNIDKTPPEQETITLKTETSFADLEKNKELFEKVCAPSQASQNKLCFTLDNPLLDNIDKLWENMGKVFPEYRRVDSDGLLEYISHKIFDRNICWKDGILTVDGAKTNILRTDVHAVFDGLKKLTTPKMADKLLGKIIVNKLKKLF